MVIYIDLKDEYVTGWSSTPSENSIKINVCENHEVLNNPFIFKYVDGELVKDEEKQQEMIDESNKPNETEIKSMMMTAIIAVRKLIRIDELTDDEIAEIIGIYEDYKVGKHYYPKDVFKYDNQLYEVIFDHTSQVDWRPSETPSTYKQITASGTIDEWRQPLGYADAYKKGDKVIYDGDVYKSLVDGNTWPPKNNPSLWEKE